MRKIITIGLAILAAGLFGQSLYELAMLSVKVPLLSHTLLVPLVSLYLFWTQRKTIFSKLQYAPISGICFLVCSLGIYSYQKWQVSILSQNDALFISIGGLVLWIWGGFMLVCGRSASRNAMFPLLFLAYMVPMPSWFLDPIVRFLQHGSTYAAQGLLRIIGVPAYFEGVYITLPGVTVEVAEECSGIRSAIALLILTTVAGYLFLRTNWRRWWLVIFVVPVTIIKNGMRIVTLALLGSYVDMSYITDSGLHSAGGKPFLVVAILMMFPIFWLLRRSEKRITAVDKQADKTSRVSDGLSVSTDAPSV